VSDGDLFGADKDILDEQPQYLLALCHVGGIGLVV
jgi:hypothetical protein